ncbi:unnamed protein product [Effrenium voratum]|nr:unnamed protein product [Effrenium voratum]
MGLCRSAELRGAAYRVGEAPLPETSGMATEDLLRRGIASAQQASAARRRRDRIQHVLLARRFLLAALHRHSQGPGASPEITAHLLAVLLKLGEDTQSVQGVLAECIGLSSESPARVASPAGAVSPEQGSSGSEVNTYGYDEMKENFLSPDSSDEEHSASPGDRASHDASPLQQTAGG